MKTPLSVILLCAGSVFALFLSPGKHDCLRLRRGSIRARKNPARWRPPERKCNQGGLFGVQPWDHFNQAWRLMSVLLRAFLRKLIKSGALEVEFSDGRRCVVGDGSPATCAMKIADRGAENALAFDPEMALGDLYMDGRITMIRGDIYDLLALAALNIGGGAPTAQIALWQKLRRLATKLRPGVRENRSRANVAHHYDLDSRLYNFFLDCDLQYSCAYFERARLKSGGGATGQKAPYRRQAGGRSRPESPRHRLRLGRPGALSRGRSARPKCMG